MMDWLKTAQGIATIAAALFGIMLAWWQLGLPRVVFSPELAQLDSRVVALDKFNRDTRLLVLDQAWWRARAQLENLDAEFADGSAMPRHVRQLRRNLEQQIRMLETQMQELRVEP